MWLAGAPALATTATAGPGLATSSPPANRSNVGATHSPQLLQQLAGPAGATRTAIRAAINQASVTGALHGVDVASFQHPNNAAIDWSQGAGDRTLFPAVEGALVQQYD